MARAPTVTAPHLKDLGEIALSTEMVPDGTKMGRFSQAFSILGKNVAGAKLCIKMAAYSRATSKAA